MKILHTVEFYHPSVGGSQEVVRQLSERMAWLGHDVTVATSYLPDRDFDNLHGVHIKQFKISGNEVRGYEGNTKDYQDFILSSDFDIIMNYAAQQWTADPIFPILDKINSCKIFVPCGFSALHDTAYKAYYSEMQKTLKKYDATVYLSNNYRDIDFARKHKIKNLHIIPNGADEHEFLSKYEGDIKKELGIPSNQKLIIHLGSFTGQKGQPEAIEIFKESKLTEATLLLVGNIFDRHLFSKIKLRAKLFNMMPVNIRNRKKTLIKQLDRTKTVAALQSADLFLFPSNIEASPLVLFEACAAKTPFLTTDVGNTREIVEWTRGGEILPTDYDKDGNSHARIKESALALSALMGDESKRTAYADNGYLAWSKKFRWDKIAEQYLELYKGSAK